jgi:transcriptional regulator with GAF, ATPase, and Fis domain
VHRLRFQGLSMKPKISIDRRYRSLLQVNEVALTETTNEAVFQGMCTVLRNLVPYRRAALALYDPHIDGLKLADLYGPYEKSTFHVGQLLSSDQTQTSWAFAHKMPLLRQDLERERRFATDEEMLEEGYRSMYSVPLVVRGMSIGAVTIVAVKRNQISADHAAVVWQMSNQIALAMECRMLRCTTHVGTKLVCPRCIGAAGGQSTVSKHRNLLSMWGKKGGRGRKRSDYN